MSTMTPEQARSKEIMDEVQELSKAARADEVLGIAFVAVLKNGAVATRHVGAAEFPTQLLGGMHLLGEEVSGTFRNVMFARRLQQQAAIQEAAQQKNEQGVSS